MEEIRRMPVEWPAGTKTSDTSLRCGYIIEQFEKGSYLLAVDRDQRFVVIELKLGRGRNRAIGQPLYYMGWVDKKPEDLKI